jgi:hypothetical protein
MAIASNSCVSIDKEYAKFSADDDFSEPIPWLLEVHLGDLILDESYALAYILRYFSELPYEGVDCQPIRNFGLDLSQGLERFGNCKDVSSKLYKWSCKKSG